MAERSEGTPTASRRRYWRREDAREAIGAWKRSGQTLSEFCRARGLTDVLRTLAAGPSELDPLLPDRWLATRAPS